MLNNAPNSNHGTPPESGVGPNQSQILIADDDPGACKAYQRMLELEGHRVLAASDFAAAAAQLQSQTFDVVLCDIVLGDDDGISLLAHIQQQNTGTPVILITGQPTVETATAAVRMGAYDYLSKPIPRDRLCHTVSKAIEFNHLTAAKKRIEAENLRYQRNLEALVTARTEKLVQSKHRFQLLFENSMDAIFIASREGRFVELNRAAVQLFGYRRDELEQMDPAALCTDKHVFERFQREMRTKGFIKDFAIKFVRQDRSIIDALLSANLLDPIEGDVAGYQGIVRDITPQKQAEEKIRAQNTFLTNVIESLAHPFMVIDAADYSVKIANAAARRKQRGQGETCYALNQGLAQPCGQTGRRCAVDEVVRTHRPAHMEYQYVDEDGIETEYEDVHAFPLFSDDGHVRQVIQYRLDITHRKRLEAVAEAANLMENLGFIFSGIRHEIGNPINSIKMALTILAKHLHSYPPETVKEFVDRAMGEIGRVEYLLKALKNFSMYDRPEIEPVDMEKFMTHFLALVENDFMQKGIRIELRAAKKRLAALADQRILHQVMLNLLTNAADALDKQEAPRIEIALNALGAYVQVQIMDNGHGMSGEELRNLFRPFYTSKAHGTGLGLVIVKKMLAQMNGSIAVKSQRDLGTTITMMLPHEK
ncbi:MAG: response regulator [Desulfobacteraceae bacterium]|nr:response regulator [Desulfobacteraceae bacterium]